MGRRRLLEIIPATGDVPVAWVAARMGFVNENTGRPDVEAFHAALPALLDRGFPRPDPTTGRFAIEAVNEWRACRNGDRPGLTPSLGARDARSVVGERLNRFLEDGARENP